jgi:hypothetical protein
MRPGPVAVIWLRKTRCPVTRRAPRPFTGVSAAVGNATGRRAGGASLAEPAVCRTAAWEAPPRAATTGLGLGVAAT